MEQRIIGIVLLAASLFTAFLGYRARLNAPENGEILRNAVYVADGSVSPEHEGKVVIAVGTLEAELPFRDKETGISLDSIVTYRRVEKARIAQDPEDGYEKWEWDPVTDPDRCGGSRKVIAPDLRLGEFSLAEELLSSVAASENRREYDGRELDRFGWGRFEDNSRVFLYRGGHMPGEDDRVHETQWADYVDTIRVSYDGIPEDQDLEYTVIGLQQQGRLLEVEALDLKAAHSGCLTAEELLEYAESEASAATLASICIAAVFLAAGLVMILLGGKKRRRVRR